MSSFVFCTSYMRPNIEFHQIRRYKRWIDYYLSLRKDLDADKLFLIDDGGTIGPDAINILEDRLPDKLADPVNIYRFKKSLGRHSPIDYPGWWRSFLFSLDIAEKYGYDKIIHIESDFFVLSPRLKEFIKNIRNGWTCLYSDHFDFPESGMQIIGRDSFHLFDELRTAIEANQYRAADCAESILPFTHVEKSFIGDRIGEERIFAEWMNKHVSLMNRLDYIAQVHIRSEADLV